MAYDNNTDKVTFIKKTGSEIISNGYQVDASSLLDSSSKLSSSLSDSDEIMVVRKFDSSSITPAITADETWSAWVLPSTNTSGSTMYTTSGSTITFSETAADYTWTTVHSGRAADVALPVLASGDTVYILRKTYALQHLVTWTAGSKITSSNLNLSGDQFLYLSQELISMWQNIHNFHPSIGQPNGLCPLNASGIISSDYITGDSLTLTTSTGISGAGNPASPIILDILDDSLVISGDKVKVDTQDILTSTSATKPLSAAQGKTLKDDLDLLGSGVVYKGVFDVEQSAVSLGLDSAVAGWTVNASTTGTAHSDFGGASVTAGDMFRYSTSWQAVSGGATTVLASGTQALTGNWAVGAYEISSTATKPSAGDGNLEDGTEKRYATLEFVEDEIAGTKLEELTEVTGTPTAGDILKRNAANDNWVQVPVSDTTDGISIGDLSNVDSGADSPSTGQTLEWSGSAWAAATGATVATQVTCSGAVTGDASQEVKDAMNHTNLGYNVTSGVSTSSLSVCEFRGREHYVGAGATLAVDVTLPHRKNIIYRNGTLKFNRNNVQNKRLVELTSSTSYAGTTSADVDTGTTIIPMTSGATFDNFRVGDHIWITADNSVSPDAADLHTEMTISNTISPNKFYSSAHGIIINKDTDENTLEIDNPLIAAFTSGATVTRYGSGAVSGDGGADQCGNILFDNMTFEDSLSSEFYLPNNPVTTTDGSDQATFNLPSGHGLVAGAGVILQHVDCTASVSEGSVINRATTIDSIATTEGIDRATITMTEDAINTGSDGEDLGKLYLSVHRGINLEYAHNITFHNCTFSGWNSYAVKLLRCYKVTFDNCTFNRCQGWSNYPAIQIEECDNIAVKNCEFNNCTLGIRISYDDKRVSSNIIIDNNKINATRGIYANANITGMIKITNNDFIGYHQNKKRAYVTAYGAVNPEGGDLSGDCMYLSGVDEFDISNNTTHKGIMNPVGSDECEEAKYWGDGNGYTTTLTGVDALNTPYFIRGIYLNWQPNRYRARPGGSFRNPRRARISDNTFDTNDKCLQIVLSYHPSSGEQYQYFKSLTITNNKITAEGYAIYIDHAYGPLGVHYSNTYDLVISHNNIKCLNYIWESPGRTTYNTPRGIHLYTRAGSGGKSGRFIGSKIESNFIYSNRDDGNALLIGVTGSTQGAFNTLHIVNNTTHNFANAFYIYQAQDKSTRSCCTYGALRNNIFRSPGSNYVGNQTRFLDYNKNNASGNMNW